MGNRIVENGWNGGGGGFLVQRKFVYCGFVSNRVGNYRNNLACDCPGWWLFHRL